MNAVSRKALVMRCDAPTSTCPTTTERHSTRVKVVTTQPPHAYPIWPGKRIGDVLIHRFNRLPLPPFSLLDDIAQTWEGEMRSNH